ncbi:MAG: NHLP leader peptide family RiPP precursor [Bacteroidales bacterium]
MNLRKEIEPKLIEMSLKDMDFRKRLIDNPAAVIINEMGVAVSESVTVKILEEDPGTIYLVLPRLASTEVDSELTDAELEAVAGGYVNDYSCSPMCFY